MERDGRTREKHHGYKGTGRTRAGKDIGKSVKDRTWNEVQKGE